MTAEVYQTSTPNYNQNSNNQPPTEPRNSRGIKCNLPDHFLRVCFRTE